MKIQNFSFMTMHLKISSAKWQPFCPRGDELMENHKYSLLMHRIKIKSPANSLWNEQHVFVCWFITFQSVLLWWYYNDKKTYRILAVLPFKMSAAWLPWDSPWSLASTSWATRYFSIVWNLSREPDFLAENRIFKNLSKSLKTCLLGVFWVFQGIFSIAWHLSREPDVKKIFKSLKSCLVGVFWVFQGILA